MDLKKLAAEAHQKELASGEFDFLTPTRANEETFMLGFAAGVEHSATLYGKQLKDLEQLLLKQQQCF